MNLEIISKIVPLAISIIVTINTFSRLEKNTKLLECYFKKVLRIYVKECKENKDIDPVIFIKERFNISDYFIPSYIFYLVDECDKEKLHKVLITDYRENFPSKKNIIYSGICNIAIIFLTIIIILSILSSIGAFIGAGVISILSIFETIFLKQVDLSKEVLYLIFMGIIGIIYVFVVKPYTIDDYTLEVKQIKSKINKKIDEFDKKSIFYVFERNKDYYIN